jgi:hypothetical protein
MWLLIAEAPALVPERRAADGRRQAELIAAGQEDAACLVHRVDVARLGALRPRRGVNRRDLGCAKLTEHLAVQLAGQRPKRRGSADDRDARLVATGKVDEARQDHPLADLVLRAANDHHVPLCHCAGV